MHTSPVLGYVPLALLVALLAFWGFSSWQFRRRVACLFDPQETDEHELHRVSNQLDALNERCPTNSFSAQRLTHIDLRGQDILLVYGRVFAHGARGSASAMSIYALGKGEQAEWMSRFSDIFDLAFTSSEISVFWVKLAALIRLTKRCSERQTAQRSSSR
jgi:hypothetical protein